MIDHVDDARRDHDEYDRSDDRRSRRGPHRRCASAALHAAEAAGQGDEARDPDEKARIDSMLASESSAAPAEAAAPAAQLPWQLDASSDDGEPVDEAAKQATNAASLPQWVQDPMTTVTDRERRMAALSVATYGKRGAELDRVLAERGMDRAQAVAEYRQLADDHPRGGPYTEQMYEYQSWAVQGETIPSF